MRYTNTPIRITCFIGILFTLLLSSCGTRAPRYDYNHRLYIESAHWIGVPYRAGGSTMKGVDCSGLTYNIYKKVYRKHLKRNSDEQRQKNCRKVSKSRLQEGDLVFFHNGKNKRTATHVGIYLKDNRFIHASTSRGVIVSRLDEPYYRRVWMQGGRVKGL